jgi:hypothetical protein
MASNLDKFKADLDRLMKKGLLLRLAMDLSCSSGKSKAELKRLPNEQSGMEITDLPSFDREYQRWYSEAIALVRQVLPDRLADFVGHYQSPKNRKRLNNENYRIEDYLQGLEFMDIYTKGSAIPHFNQQLAIVQAAEARFESSLFDIRQMVQADILDSEIEAAEHLLKFNFVRAAGALAGVVLERHLAQVTENHKINIKKKNPTIADFNEALKAEGVIDLPQWRYVQHLADLRNLCYHARTPDPTSAQVTDLIEGVKKVTKTFY